MKEESIIPIYNKQSAKILNDSHHHGESILTSIGMKHIKCWRDKKICRTSCAAFAIVDGRMVKCKALPSGNQYIAKLEIFGGKLCQ